MYENIIRYIIIKTKATIKVNENNILEQSNSFPKYTCLHASIFRESLPIIHKIFIMLYVHHKLQQL